MASRNAYASDALKRPHLPAAAGKCPTASPHPQLGLVEDGSAEPVENGFSIKLADARIARLLRQESERQAAGASATRRHGYSVSGKTRGARTGRRHAPSMRPKREPLVVWNDVERAFYKAIGAARIEADETVAWPAIWIGSRISRLEQGTSTSPERQVRNVADWCVKHQRRPVGLLAEETSGSIWRQRRRALFEQFVEDLEEDRIRDPETGELIDGIAYWRYDRVTRDPDEGGALLRLLMRKKINLYATQYMDPPRDLYTMEHEIRDKWIEAAREVDNNRARVLDEIGRKLAENEPVFGCDLWGRERVIDPKTGRTLRYKAIPKCQRLAVQIAEDVIAGKSIYALVAELAELGVVNTVGRPFQDTTLRNLLRRSHLAGLVRIRVDEKASRDPDYTGELSPPELIYPEGGSPPADFVPAIEPLVPYPLWQRLQAALDGRHVTAGPRKQYLSSCFFECGACRDHLNAKSPDYSCAKRAIFQGRRGLGASAGEVRRRRQGRTVTSSRARGPRAVPSGRSAAADGRCHASIGMELLDTLVSEVIFAAINSSAAVTQEVQEQVQETRNAQRKALLAQLQTFAQRLADTTYMFSRGDITRARYTELADEIKAEQLEVEADLRALSLEETTPRLPEGKTLRELWPGMSVERRRQWLELVLESGTVEPCGRNVTMPLATRVKLRFRNGYEPPAEEVAALIDRVEREFILKSRRKRTPSPALAARLLELHETGLTRKEILEALTREGWETPEGEPWTVSRLQYTTKLVYEAAGLERPPRPAGNRGAIYDEETLKVMRDIYTHCRKWTETAAELNRLGITMLDGSPWTNITVAGAVRYTARRLGWDLPAPISRGGPRSGRPRYLDQSMRERIWQMHRVEGESLRDIAAWLADRGIMTAAKKKTWNVSSIFEVVRSVDEEKRREQRALDQRSKGPSVSPGKQAPLAA